MKSRLYLGTILLILVGSTAGAGVLTDGEPFSTNWFDDNENGLWLGNNFGGSSVYPTAGVTGPEGDGVVGTMTAPAGGLGFCLGAVGWTVYPLRLQYVVQVLDVPEGESLRTRIGFSADGNNQDDVTVEFLHHSPEVLSANVRSRNETFAEVSQTWGDTGLSFSPGDWARLTLLIPSSDAVEVSIEKWDSGASAFVGIQTRVVDVVDTSAAGGIVGRDFKRLTAGLLPSPGIESDVTMNVDVITVEDDYTVPMPVIVGPSVVQEGDDVTLNVLTAGLSGPLTYVWEKDGEIIPGTDAPTLELLGVMEEDAGEYVVFVTDASEVTYVSDPFVMNVLAGGQLPVSSLPNLLALVCFLSVLGGLFASSKRRDHSPRT